jgi:hypothetical protein
MQITTHVDELQRQLAAAAATGTEEAQEVAGRLARALESAARLAIIEALSDAAGEITRELAPGSVDVRVRGRDVEFVVSRAETQTPASPEPTVATADTASADDDDAATTRTTLRLPDGLKARADAAATAEGISLNAWFVRAVAAALEPKPPVRETRGSSYTGWVR